jgi:hypothetical protein
MKKYNGNYLFLQERFENVIGLFIHSLYSSTKHCFIETRLLNDHHFTSILVIVI